MDTNTILQWLGTICFLEMYVVSSFFIELYPLNLVLAIMGTLFYLMWSVRVRNKPQMITNIVGLSICVVGLFKYYLGV